MIFTKAMGKGKLSKFADMAANPLVVECTYGQLHRHDAGEDGNGIALQPDAGSFLLRGRWHEDFFRNQNPITLELGCGRGEYTVGLGREYPGRNFIGVDIKGSRMWHGAREALHDGMTNVGFLRTNIECIHELFGVDEVNEIWLTFSDPQMKKPTKRLTSTYFMERYRRFLVDDGLIHLKTDSNFLYRYTKLMAEHNHLTILAATDDLYGKGILSADFVQEGVDVPQLTSIQTYYERMWLEKGLAIKNICFRLPKEGVLEESGVEIEMDDYRSYDHDMVKEVKMAK